MNPTKGKREIEGKGEGTMRTILIKTHLSESIENWSGGKSYLPNDHYNFNFGCIIHTNEKS